MRTGLATGVVPLNTLRRSIRNAAAAVFLILLAVFTVLQTTTTGRQSQSPVFKSKVEVVQLDVSVLDKHRQPVKGLTEADFTVLEDGRPQKIVGLSTFDVDDTGPPPTGWMRDVASDVATNDLKAEARLFVIVMDDALIPQEPFSIRSSKEIANKLIDSIGLNDLVAIVFTADNRRTQDFTGDKVKLRAALDNFSPGQAGYRFGMDSPPPPPANSSLAKVAGQPIDSDLWFYQSSVRTLQNVAEYLETIPNRRKALFWISPGVPLDLAGAVPSGPRGEKLGVDLVCVAACADMPVFGQKFPPGDMTDLQHRTEDVFLHAQRANVAIYPIDPAGMDGMRTYLAGHLGPSNAEFGRWKAATQFDYLESTAANTGGRAIVNTNEFASEIAEIFDENRSYYLLAFEPDSTTVATRLRKLQVKVDRDDVEVRTRSSYYPSVANPSEEKKIAKSGLTPEAVALAKSMAGILPTAGMPMRASVAAFAVPGQRLSTVTVALGLTLAIPAEAANGRITETTELLTSAFTPEGDPKGAQKHSARVVLRPGSNGDAAYEVLAKIDLPAGRYQLRLAAHDSTAGKDGSVFVEVTIPDYSNVPFSASQVLLNAKPGRVSAPKDLFSSLLPLVPTAERTFSDDQTLTAFMRLYQSGQRPIDKVAVSITTRNAQDQVEAQETRTVVADQFSSLQNLTPAPTTPPNGRGALTLPPTQVADKFANLSLRSADVKYQIPLVKLTPGPHLLSIEATLGMTTVRRDVRFDLRR